MTDQIFIDSLWINTQLDFTKPQPSSWTITQKRSEQVHQLDKHDIEYFTPSHFSYSSAVFLCHNTILRNYEAFLKLYKQIPHAGTSEIEADFKFAESRVRHMPVSWGTRVSGRVMMTSFWGVMYIIWCIASCRASSWALRISGRWVLLSRMLFVGRLWWHIGELSNLTYMQWALYYRL